MPMEWLNYHHLYYFWMVAHEGSIARACERLYLAQPTVNEQIHELERMLGEKLFTRTGRSLSLTEAGHVAFRYADEIFSPGREFLDTLRDRPTGRPRRCTVGVADVLPKLIVYRLLKPVMEMPEAVHLICRERSPDALPVGRLIALQARLKVLRKKDTASFAEVVDRTQSEPQFLYRVGKVRHILEDMVNNQQRTRSSRQLRPR
jgi:DNA-binding transcriptional LysR family regulator